MLVYQRVSQIVLTPLEVQVDYFCLNVLSVKMPLFLVRIYNQQVQATITLMIFDLQGAFQIPRHLPLKHNFVKKERVF